MSFRPDMYEVEDLPEEEQQEIIDYLQGRTA